MTSANRKHPKKLPSNQHATVHPDQPGLWSPATHALIESLRQEGQVPWAAELMCIPFLFDTAAPHRMNPQFLGQLRERVMAGRVRCGADVIDDFIDDVLSDDLTLESFFVVQDPRGGHQLHPLSRSQRPMTPFEVATDCAWRLSVNESVRPEESALMHAAGLFYGLGYFRCAHPGRVASRNGLQATLDDVRRGRRLALSAPLNRFCELLPEQGALLTALLLGWTEARGARRLAHLDEDDATLIEQYARLLTQLHLGSMHIPRIWREHVRWSQQWT